MGGREGGGGVSRGREQQIQRLEICQYFTDAY